MLPPQGAGRQDGVTVIRMTPPLAVGAGGKGADRVHRAIRVDGKRLQEQWYIRPPLANDTREIDLSAH